MWESKREASNNAINNVAAIRAFFTQILLGMAHISPSQVCFLFILNYILK